jgi:hypothetical protein
VKLLGSALACALLVGCGSAGPGSSPPTFEDLVRDPGSYDGRHIELDTGYLTSFEVSVLTSGFAESYPPQPTRPMIWVSGSPPDRCLERASGTAWSESVRAEGTFVYRPDGGLGHVGAYTMALEDAVLTCA